MITEEELDKIGFLKYGEEEDDVYFKIVFMTDTKFGITSLAGSLDEGSFYLYDDKRYYHDIEDLEKLLSVVGGENIYRRWKK